MNIFLIKLADSHRENRWFVWWVLSILLALYFASISIYHAFSDDYIVQDDVRIHIVWLQKFSDSELFPNDFLAHYFIYFAPLGFKLVYWLSANLGIEPLILAKILPGVLGLITAIYVYWFSLLILPKHFCAFLSSLFVTQLIWLNDDLISATPRAFVYPLFAAFLYYLAAEKLLSCLLVMFILGLFYPQVLLVEVAILSLGLIKIKRMVRLTKKIRDYRWWLLGLTVSAIALFPYTQKSAQWSIITASQMQQLPEFQLYGRTYFYGVGWLRFLFGGDSGLCLPKFPPIVWLGFALPWYLQKPNSIAKLVTPKVHILLRVTIASLLMFVIAHLLLLEIHLPSRYTYHTGRFVLAIASAIVITIFCDSAFTWLRNKEHFQLTDKIAVTLVTIFTLNVIIFPMIPHVFINWFQNWRVGESPAIYQYLARQPKDIVIASLSDDANNIPAFASRSILVGEEFAFPYHPYYHREIQQRAKDLIDAQYSTYGETLLSFIDRYNIDYLLLDKTAFTPQYLQTKNWLLYSSWQNTTKKAMAKLKTTATFVLPPLVKTCSVVSTQKANLLDTKCISDRL